MPHPFFEASTYPWARREALELHKTLFQAVRDFEQIELLYAQCKADLLPLANGGAAVVWKEALERLTTAGALRVLCDKLLADSNYEAIHVTVFAPWSPRRRRQSATATPSRCPSHAPRARR